MTTQSKTIFFVGGALAFGLFLAPLASGAESQARLGVFVTSQETQGWFGEFYYRQPEVECRLDGKVIYKGPVRKGSEKTRIFHQLVPSGRHKLELRWRAHVRGDEATRVNLGRRNVDWIYVPEKGFAEHSFAIEGGQTKAIHAVVDRHFGLFENKGIISFQEGVWSEDSKVPE